MKDTEQSVELQVLEAREKGDMEIDLMEVLYRMIEKWKLIAAAAILGALAMGYYSFFVAEPTYEATSKLYVVNPGDSAINISDIQLGSYLAKDYLEVFSAWEVHEMVMQNLNLDYSYAAMNGMISVTNPANTRILRITAYYGDPEMAATLANEYAEVGSKYISETMQTDTPTLLTEALPPTGPVSPKKTKNMMMGFIVGAAAMVVLVFIHFILDDKIKNAEDIRKYTGMATLAILPSSSDQAPESKKNAKEKARRQKK